jgi:hypothetical protein
MDLESLGKEFTRYFVPGLVLLTFAGIVPATILGANIFFGADPPIGATQAIVLSIVSGYVLDSIRGYRWTLSLRQYNLERRGLAEKLAALLGETSPNPDDYLAVLWRKDEPTYDRIFAERAEWVMILETSFAMLISAGILASGMLYLIFVCEREFNWYMWIVPVILGTASILASRNGIERMRAHNLKLVEAVRALLGSESGATGASRAK